VLSLVQVANEFKVHVPTVKRWIRSGRMRAVRLGERDFVRPAEVARVRALMEQGRF
jgi:excisionase family DNA binding protein